MVQKKRARILHQLLKVTIIIVTIAAALALFFAAIAKFMPPTFSMLIAYCGLLFPYILAANAITFVVWLIIDYRWALLPISLIILNVNNIDKHFQWHPQDKPERCANCLKVMSYNAHSFNVYGDNFHHDSKQVINFLKKEVPDILCIQEYFYDKSGKLKFNSTEEILEALHLPKDERYYKLYLPYENVKDYQFGMAVFSRYRIIDYGVVEMNDSSSNKSMYVDIRYNNDTLRIYNVHLSSMHLVKEDYETGQAMLHNDMNDPKFNKKARNLFGKVENAFIERRYQAASVRDHIDTCDRRMIICGDFNDSPASYSVHKIGHGFRDSFRSSGKGLGTTYYGDAFPNYRIDYILHNRQYNDFGYTVCDELKTSDHYPIYTYISIIEKK